MNQAELSRLVSTLRVSVKPRHRQMATPEGPAGRLKALRATVTALLKYERIELYYNRADEARGYAERLISDAIRYGDTHKHTMEMADFWLEEKQLIHKLFKVLVPRYENFPTAYTRLVLGPNGYGILRVDERFLGHDKNKWREWYSGTAILELKGNPFPPLRPDTHSHHFWLHNVLLDEARRELQAGKISQDAHAPVSPATPLKDS